RAGRPIGRRHRDQTRELANSWCLDRERECMAKSLLFCRCFRREGLGQGRRRAQETSNTKIVDSSADQSSQQRSKHWHPPYPGSIGESVVLKSSDGGEKARPKIASRVDRVSVHAAEAHANGDHH